MPKLDVTITEGQLSDEARRELPEQLAAALLRWEGAPDTEFFRSIAWAHLHELPAAAIRTPDGEADAARGRRRHGPGGRAQRAPARRA